MTEIRCQAESVTEMVFERDSCRNWSHSCQLDSGFMTLQLSLLNLTGKQLSQG